MLKERKANIFLFIFEILVILILILHLIYKSDFTYNLYWICVPVGMHALAHFVSVWTKPGLNVDKNKSATIYRSVSDVSTFAITVYGIVYMIIVLIDEKFNFTSNTFAIIGFFVFTAFIDYLLRMSILGAKNDNIKLIEKNNLGK